MKLKLARIAAVVAVALPMANVFAAASDRDTSGTDQTQAMADQHKWYQAGDRALQAEKDRQELEAAGFPQYGS